MVVYTGSYARPGLGWAVLSGMALWTALAAYLYADPRRRGWPLLVADLAVTAVAVLSSSLGADRGAHRRGRPDPDGELGGRAGHRLGGAPRLVRRRDGGGRGRDGRRGRARRAGAGDRQQRRAAAARRHRRGLRRRRSPGAPRRPTPQPSSCRRPRPSGSGCRGRCTTACCRPWRWSPAARTTPSWRLWPPSRRARCAGSSPGRPSPVAHGEADLRPLLPTGADLQLAAPADAGAAARCRRAPSWPRPSPRPSTTPGGTAAASAWLLVEDEPDAVTVTVRDDGPGIAPGRLEQAAAEGRLGVAQSIRGRVEDLGGTRRGRERAWAGDGGGAACPTVRRLPAARRCASSSPTTTRSGATPSSATSAAAGLLVVGVAGDGEKAVRVCRATTPGRPGVRPADAGALRRRGDARGGREHEGAGAVRLRRAGRRAGGGEGRRHRLPGEVRRRGRAGRRRAPHRRGRRRLHAGAGRPGAGGVPPHRRRTTARRG